MRSIRIYQPGCYQVGETIVLDPAATHHIAVVLRCTLNQELTLFCGDNREFEAIIVAMDKKKVSVKLRSARLVNRESPQMIHLAQGLSKGERMEFIVQKAVELGVASITPLFTQYCAVKWEPSRLIKKQQQWQAIAVNACEQCGRNIVPLIHMPILLQDYLAQPLPYCNIVLSPTAHQRCRNYDFHEQTLHLLIGPEGGFSEAELAQFTARNFALVSLGPRILRTETATISALSILQSLYGDL